MTEEDRDRRLGTSNMSFGKQMDCLKQMDDESNRKIANAITESVEIHQAVNVIPA